MEEDAAKEDGALRAGSPHTHQDSGGREAVWLAKEPEESASVARHPFCVVCGTVRNLSLPKAHPLGYYLSGLAALKEHLEHAPLRPKLAQVQTHLIASRLASRPEFEDSYGTPGRAQLHAYVDVIRSIRADLEEELILWLLPGVRARRRKDADPETDRPIPSNDATGGRKLPMRGPAGNAVIALRAISRRLR